MPVIIYISGSISSDPDYQRKFYRAEDLLRNRHPFADIINPARNAIGSWEGLTKAEIWGEFMQISREQVKRSDIVATLSGWEKSRGAVEEVALAKENGVLIFSVESLLK